MIEAEATDNQKDANSSEQEIPKQVVLSGQTAQVLIKDDSESPISELDMHNNDTKILSLLNEVGSNYSFKGIMRKLDMHQQSLSRALHRLEELGLVKRSDGGYALSGGGESLASLKISNGNQIHRQYIQLLQTYIPVSNIRPEEVAQGLVGKWFKNLRWLGMISGPSSFTLQWSSEDGSYQVNLQIVSDYVVIETNAATEKDKVGAMAGSYAIFEHIARMLQSRVGAYILDRMGQGSTSYRNN